MAVRRGPVFEIAMANIGPNKGRRLRIALSRFSAMLIEECRDLSGLTYPQLDEALDLPADQAYRWSKFGGRIGSSGNKKERAPQAGSMKALELKVAKFLGRPAHKLIVESNSGISPTDLLRNLAVSELAAGIDVRGFDQVELQIGYEDDWPTYRRLKYSGVVDLVALYRWQWRVLWDPEVCKDWGDAKVERTIQELFAEAKKNRALLMKTSPWTAGNLPEIGNEIE